MRTASIFSLTMAFVLSISLIKAQTNIMYINNQTTGVCDFDIEVLASNITCGTIVNVPALAFTIPAGEDETLEIDELENELGSGYKYVGVNVITPYTTLTVYINGISCRIVEDYDESGDCMGDLIVVDIDHDNPAVTQVAISPSN